MKNERYAIVGGMSIQLYSHNYDMSIPKRPTNDFDISVENISFKEFSNSYGDNISRKLKNKFGYGFYLRNNHFANTIHTFDKSNRDENFLLMHFNRYQDELYERIKDEIVFDLDNRVLDSPLFSLLNTDLKVKVLNPYRTKEFKEHRFNKKEDMIRLEKSREPYILKVYEDIKSDRKLDNIDLDKFYHEMVSSIGIVNSPYTLTKEMYDLVILNQIFGSSSNFS